MGHIFLLLLRHASPVLFSGVVKDNDSNKKNRLKNERN